MRTAITIGFPEKGEPVLIFGPHVPIAEQKSRIKQALTLGSDDQFARVEYWESSGGLMRTVKFKAVKKPESTPGDPPTPPTPPPASEPETPPDPEEEAPVEPSDPSPNTGEDIEGPTLDLPAEPSPRKVRR